MVEWTRREIETKEILLTPSASADFLAEDFLAEDFLAEDFLAEDFLAEDFLAEDFLAEDFLAEKSYVPNTKEEFSFL